MMERGQHKGGMKVEEGQGGRRVYEDFTVERS